MRLPQIAIAHQRAVRLGEPSQDTQRQTSLLQAFSRHRRAVVRYGLFEEMPPLEDVAYQT